MTDKSRRLLDIAGFYCYIFFFWGGGGGGAWKGIKEGVGWDKPYFLLNSIPTHSSSSSSSSSSSLSVAPDFASCTIQGGG